MDDIQFGSGSGVGVTVKGGGGGEGRVWNYEDYGHKHNKNSVRLFLN